MQEIKDVEYGNDVSLILDEEFVSLADDDLQFDFFRKFANEELLQFTMEDYVDSDAGPICIYVDISGSMHGKPLWMSFGFSLAIFKALTEEGRRVDIHLYDTRPRTRFSSVDLDQDELIRKLVSSGCGGGTDFQSAFLQSTQLYPKFIEDYEDADFLVITDGMDHISDPDSINEIKDQAGAEMAVLKIGNKNPGPFATICERTICVGQDDLEGGLIKLIETGLFDG